LDNKYKYGFTLIELILSMGLLMIIIISASAFSSSWYLQNNLDGAKNMLMSSLRQSQSFAMAKKNNLTWGVCLTGKTIRMFGGSCASPTIKNDYLLPSSVTINGLSTVTFSSFRGEPNSAQAISLIGNNKTYNLVVNLGGGISVN
jgi:Tfp pilus assembly protein FimT